MIREPLEFRRIATDDILLQQMASGDRSSALPLLRIFLAERFKRLTGFDLLVMPVRIPPSPKGDRCPAPAYCFDQPDCARFCRRAWGRHVAALAEGREIPWHRTPCGRLSALVPLVRNGETLEAARVVCSGEVPEPLWISHLEYVGLLTTRLANGQMDDTSDGVPSFSPPLRPAPGIHPLVCRSKAMVDARFADPDLTVAGIAAALEVNATYLSHLFSVETGQRLSAYINKRRLEHAKRLLSSTTWSVKHIAFECGFVNTSWFGQRFRAHTGVTPGQFRRGAATV